MGSGLSVFVSFEMFRGLRAKVTLFPARLRARETLWETFPQHCSLVF